MNREIKNSESPSKLNGFLVVRDGCLFFCFKRPQVNIFLKVGNINLPRIFFAVIGDNPVVTAYRFCRVVFVPSVFKLANNSKICFSVVKSAMINMVYLAIYRKTHYQMMKNKHPFATWPRPVWMRSDITSGISFRESTKAPPKILYPWVIFFIKKTGKFFHAGKNFHAHGFIVNVYVFIRPMLVSHAMVYSTRSNECPLELD